MTAEQNKALIRRLVEARNERDDVTHDSLLADDWVVHSWWLNPVAQDGTPVREDKVVREQMRRNRELMREQYPTAREEINELFVADDTVTVVTTAQVTRRDGKTVTRKAIAVHRIADGKIVESWGQWDRLGHFQQLGLVPPSAELVRQARV